MYPTFFRALVYSTTAILFITMSCCTDDDMTDDTTPMNNGMDLSGIPYSPQSYTLIIPTGFPQMEIPEDNPLTVDGIELGRHLFYDPILSRDSTMSCSSCHLPEAAFTDNLAVSTGVDEIAGIRSSMSLVNVGFYNTGLFWDGRVFTLENQALLPVEDEIELHDQWDNVEEKLQRSSFYPELFRKAFGIENSLDITRDLATKAIAQFERTLVSGNSRYDKILQQNMGFFTDEELNGHDMFFDKFDDDESDAECAHCHNQPLFTGNDYHNNGLDNAPDLDDFSDNGLGDVTNNMWDNGKFRAPTLRNIELTAPYMHDGRFQTLEEVLDHYSSGGHYAPNLDPNMRTLDLSQQEKQDIISFLKTLTDTSFVNNPAFQNPFE